MIQFAQKAVIHRDDTLLMVRKALTDPFQPGRWELPGGRLQQGETPDEALVREVREEVGLTVQPGLPLALWSWRLQDSTVVAVARSCEIVSGELDLSGHDVGDHIERAAWVELDTVLKLDLIPSARTPITTVLERL